MQECNVRVAVRVRPLLPKERVAGEQTCVKILPKTNQLVLGKDRAFTFDHVLSSRISQQQAYDACMLPLLAACFEGYNATVFAYGQTGSGKTFTMGGGNIAAQTEEEFGIIPRAIKQMYDHMQSKPQVEFRVKVSYIEIYKEELRDLLDHETSSKDLHIREDDKANTVITGATEVECEGLEEVMSCLEQGSTYRHTGSTQMNEHSSRSHSVFTMLIEQRWSDQEENSGKSTSKTRSRLKSEESEVIIEDLGDIEHYMCSKFHFVDLAGSERAHRTGNVGDRFKESVHINSGLLALGNVISALGDVKKKVSHIPYRDSKITRLLKDSLGGNAKTVMICCISPSTSNLDESLNALKYANRARNIKNKPIVNRDPQSIRFEEMQTEIRALRAELQRQRTSILTAGNDLELQRAIQEAGVVKEMEDKVVRLQTECAHYRMVAEEAYKQLVDIQGRDLLSHSQHGRLHDWLELMEEIKNKVPATLNREAWENQTIQRLENELKQCKDDLKSDEEIFAEKAREMNNMQEALDSLRRENEELLARCEEQQEAIKEQEAHLVEKEVRIEELLTKIKEAESRPELELDTSVEIAGSGPPTTRRRAKSVPVHTLHHNSKLESLRNIHTSPALFSLERVMQGFRARSQLLLSRLEENDDVLQQHFSGDEDNAPDSDLSDDEDDDIIVGGASSGRGGAASQPGKVKTTSKESNKASNFNRQDERRGTYKVRRPKLPQPSITIDDTDALEQRNSLRKSQTDDEKLSLQGTHKLSRSKIGVKGSRGEVPVAGTGSSTEQQRKQLKQTELEVRQSTQKMKDLAINIRMKEQLIKELVKTGRESQQMNRQYEDRIRSLEEEKQRERQELMRLQSAMQELEASKQQDKTEKDRLQNEFRKKMELAKTRIHALQKKQKETEKMATITGTADKRIQELQGAISKMRDQQEQLQRRLKEETERKLRLEREMSKEQQKIRELEIRNEQQKKVLKVKTNEMSAMQKRLRSGSQLMASNASSTGRSLVLSDSQLSYSDEQGRLEEQKKWLDGEVERVLEQRLQVEQLQKELSRREDIVAKKEAMLAERSELEIKKLRSSQILNKDLVVVSGQLEAVERQIEEKTREAATTPRGSEAQSQLRALRSSRERLGKQLASLEKRMQGAQLLAPQEERRLLEVEEAIDALDAAIEYRNEAIVSRQQQLRQSSALSKSQEGLTGRLRALTMAETRALLTRYFDRVIDLRDSQRKKELECSELEVRVEEQDRRLRQLDASLQRAALERDRCLTTQQQEHERRVQLLMKQLAEAQQQQPQQQQGVGSGSGAEMQAKVQQLEKDLYYYKKTSRDLKKKLRELMAGMMTERDRAASAASHTSENGGDSYTHVSTPRDQPASSSRSSKAHHGNSHHQGQGDSPSNASTPREAGIKEGWDRLGQVRDGSSATHVRISRKELRRMSTEEVNLRRSAGGAEVTTPLPQDSLEEGGGDNNPWT